MITLYIYFASSTLHLDAGSNKGDKLGSRRASDALTSVGVVVFREIASNASCIGEVGFVGWASA